MKVKTTKLNGVFILQPECFQDERGFFLETFNKNQYLEAGINFDFVQDNYSRSSRGVLRGLHFQKNSPQGKLVSCSNGSVFDVVVDIDPKSPTFCHHISIELSDINNTQLWIPPGYAHGFCVLSDVADFRYKCTSYYDANDSNGIIWNDPDIGIDWPIENPVLSEKDKRNLSIREALN
tara:strand:+ start:37 stop:570 length:534 start_codon:yes stop_codon:yes gene_type:complete